MLRSFLAALAAASSLTLIVPALAQGAAAVQVTAAGELRVDDYLGEPDDVTISFQTAAQSGGVDGFLVVDEAGAGPYNTSCTRIDARTVACPAAGVTGIGAGLSAGNDVLAVSTDPSSAVPALPLRVKGGEGSDVVQGGHGEAFLVGEGGRDVLAGGRADDRLSGGSGRDGLIGAGGDDVLSGGGGKDALFGLAGTDTFTGGPGNDVLLARDHRRDRVIDCGPGSSQRAVRDRIDPPAVSCGAQRKRKKARR